MSQPPAGTNYPNVAPRYPLIAEASVTDLDTGTQLNCRTCDISASGCYLDTMNPFPGGTRVEVVIRYNGESLSVIGAVPYAQPNMGMGVRFVEVAPEQQARLQRWLAELSGAAPS
jgi:c-di-GMP-binding flagellar brake protein YcgR